MSKKDLLAAGALKTGKIEISGQSYEVREATAAINDEIFKLYQAEGNSSANAYMVVQCLYDEGGARVFDDADLDEVKALSPAFVSNIVKAINGLTDWDAAKN